MMNWERGRKMLLWREGGREVCNKMDGWMGKGIKAGVKARRRALASVN